MGKFVIDRTLPPPGEIRGQFASDLRFGPKDHVLLVGGTEYDQEVIEAYASNFRRDGAKVDVFTIDFGTLGISPEEAAAAEATSLVPGEDNSVYSVYCDLLTPRAARALTESQGYTAIVAGTAGPYPEGVKVPWKRLPYIYWQEIASKQLELPLEVLYAIDRKVVEQTRMIRRARLTDPEGTDISWTNYEDGRPLALAHEYCKPFHIGYNGPADCTGVVAGTINHVGAFPNAKAYLKNDLVVKVEGGGRYGDVWREKIEELNKIELPPVGFGGSRQGSDDRYRLPGPGFFWFWEMAIGTIPGVFRVRKESRFECFANFLHDRRRAGVIHNGFGPPTGSKPMMVKSGIPWTHVHLHNFFPTLEGATEDGESVIIVDKGHLTALDDPEVRKVAGRLGTSSRQLRESWIPAVPGINAPGDYWEDYANDPGAWIRKEATNLP